MEIKYKIGGSLNAVSKSKEPEEGYHAPADWTGHRGLARLLERAERARSARSVRRDRGGGREHFFSRERQRSDLHERSERRVRQRGSLTELAEPERDALRLALHPAAAAAPLADIADNAIPHSPFSPSNRFHSCFPLSSLLLLLFLSYSPTPHKPAVESIKKLSLLSIRAYVLIFSRLIHFH